jgi:hypothetical protein
MIYHFANWLLEAKAKLDRMNRSVNQARSRNQNLLTALLKNKSSF